MRSAFARVYQSFEEFEREELHQIDSLSGKIDDMLGDMFADELSFDEADVLRSRSRDSED